MHRRRPGHRRHRRARLIGPIVRWLDRLVGRAARARPGRRFEPIEADPIERAFDRSGYAREAAVRELGSSPRPEAIRVLLLRANDWVPEVRVAAAAALTAHLRDDFVPAWAMALDALTALRSAGRVDRAALLGPIDAFLTAQQRLERLAQATRDAPVGLRRIVGALRRSATTDPAALALVLGTEAASGDIVTALAATHAANDLSEPTLRDRVWSTAARSPHAAVRRAAVADALGRAGDDPRQRAALIDRFAFDPSDAVRAQVRAAADQAERNTIGAASRRLLDAPRPASPAADDRVRAIALHTLIALGADDAEARSAASLDAPGASLRAVALAGSWPRADRGAREQLLLAAFTDDAPRVQRWAARAVLREGLVPSWRDLLAIVVQSPSPSRLAAVRRALGRASPWWRLGFELSLAEAAGRYDRPLLGQWCSDVDRIFVAPAAGEHTELATAWRRASPHLDAVIAEAVRTRLIRFGVIAD
ncbi:MAG TPA: hypothetical protein VH041_09765 [Caldimonas sp.]|nr:hypothetical protein [Caldimonas sp.]